MIFFAELKRNTKAFLVYLYLPYFQISWDELTGWRKQLVRLPGL